MTTVSVPTVAELKTEAAALRTQAKAEGTTKEDAAALRAKANLLDARALVMAEAPDLLVQPEPTPEPTPEEQFAAARAATLAHFRSALDGVPLAFGEGELEALVAGLSAEVNLQTTRTTTERRAPGSGAHKGLVGYGGSTAADRKDASGSSLRKIYSARVSGPFLWGVCNTAGGYLVRDTRTDADSVSKDGLVGVRLAKKAEAEAYVADALAKSGLSTDELVALADAARARIASDGTAR